MEFRALTPEEIDTLPDEFYADVDKLGTDTRFRPDMAGSLVGAFDGQTLVGIWGAVVQIHCGPLWVAKNHRGQSTDIRAGMWRVVRELVSSWGSRFAYMFAMDDAPGVRHIIEKMPHRELHGRAFLMEI